METHHLPQVGLGDSAPSEILLCHAVGVFEKEVLGNCRRCAEGSGEINEFVAVALRDRHRQFQKRLLDGRALRRTLGARRAAEEHLLHRFKGGSIRLNQWSRFDADPAQYRCDRQGTVRMSDTDCHGAEERIVGPFRQRSNLDSAARKHA